MFRGVVDRPSHEGGLLVTFSGSSPALGSIIVREEDGQYIGKIDAVIGSTDAPLAHVAHLDRKQENDSFIGTTVVIRAKKEREERPQREHRQEREERPRRDSRSFDRRDNRRGGDSQKEDWVCASCNNVNFSWRTECNSCGITKQGNVKEYKSSFRDNNRSDNRRDRSRQENHGRNDWECPSCNNINFSFRTECNQCGKPKSGGGGGGRNSDRRGGRDGGRSFGGNRGGRDSDSRGGRDSDRRGGRDGGRSFGGNRGGRDSDSRGGRDSDRRGGRDGGRDNRAGDDDRPNERYRKARGKRPGHAHNRGPKPIRPRRYQGNNRDD